MPSDWAAFGLLITFLTTWTAYAGPLKNCDDRNISPRDPIATLRVCQDLARAQQKEFLPGLLSEQLSQCQTEAPFQEDKNFLQTCLTEPIKFAGKVLSCESSPQRLKEIASDDVRIMNENLKQAGEVKVPSHVQDLFARLHRIAEKNHEFLLAPQWNLKGYKGAYVNARSGADGHIIMTDGTWDGTLAEDEIAAVLSHEISHVILQHSLKTGCQALEWDGADMSLGEAIENFHQDMDPLGPRSKAWKKLSQGFEFDADHLALSLLKEANYDSGAMARVLKKLMAASSGGNLTGSHPDLNLRIEKALEK